jgi:hypothetical protein
MTRVVIAVALAALAAGVSSDATQANGGLLSWLDRAQGPPAVPANRSFNRVATLANYRQYDANAADQTVSEIVAATADGLTLVYTDAARGNVGLVDISDPRNPQPLGVIAIDPDPDDAVDYSPTSVDVLGNQYALVAASTGVSLTSPDGSLVVIDLTSRMVVAEIPLGGQPDSLKISPDHRYAAIAIENERDEELCVGGTAAPDADEDACAEGGGVLGGLPQTPANPPGHLAVMTLLGAPGTWAAPAVVALTGLSSYAPEDPEPEFVDINANNEAVVTLQENNHLVIVDLPTLSIKTHFPMGAVTLTGVDVEDDGMIALTETLADVAREPDAVAWVPGWFGTHNIATANEGDLFGGSRGFSIFQQNGHVWFDSGTTVEQLAVRHGHYPEGRSDNKGNEPEAIAYARFGKDDYLFVGSERGSFVAVYALNRVGRPEFQQLLPAPLAPEGVLPIPQRNLLIASGEGDLEGLNVRSTIAIYELGRGQPSYPQIVSADRQGAPIPWSALSGMVAVPGHPHALLAVWDSAFSASKIFRIDATKRPAVIVDAVTLTPGDGIGDYDPEGIAVAPDGSIWIASEGNATDLRPNLLLKVDVHGNVLEEIGLPAEILQCRADTTRRGTLGSGFEGLAVWRSAGRGGAYKLVVAQQRGWDYTTPDCEDLDDDAGGLNARGEPNRTRLWIYDPVDGRWDHVAWELEQLSPLASWVGLSEITAVPGEEFIVIERDNRTGDFAVLKTLAKFRWSDAGDGVVNHADKSVYDLLPHFLATNGWVTDKPEGVAVTMTGELFVVSDNDAVDDWSGETWFFGLGRYWQLFD